MPKKEVLYTPTAKQKIVVGASALVKSINHPNCRYQGMVLTSEVLAYDPKLGTFETKNSHYIPQKEFL